MKKTALTASVILLFAALLCVGGCTGESKVSVKANKDVVSLVKSWDPKLAFYTSKNDPLKSVEGLRQGEIACFGPEISDHIQAFYNAAGIKKEYGNAVQVAAPSTLSFAAKDAPRLFLTWSSYGPKMKDAVKVSFSE